MVSLLLSMKLSRTLYFWLALSREMSLFITFCWMFFLYGPRRYNPAPSTEKAVVNLDSLPAHVSAEVESVDIPGVASSNASQTSTKSFAKPKKRNCSWTLVGPTPRTHSKLAVHGKRPQPPTPNLKCYVVSEVKNAEKCFRRTIILVLLSFFHFLP